MKIIKLNNWKNNLITCNCCKKEIRHHYSIKGVEGVYGLACAQTIINTDEIKNIQIETIISEITKLEKETPLPFLSDDDKIKAQKSIDKMISNKLLELEELKKDDNNN